MGPAERIAALGAPLGIDPLPLLAERLPYAGPSACRLMPAADGLVAVNLARPEDLDLLPAWLGIDDPADVPAAVAKLPAAEVVQRAALLSLPVSRAGEVAAPPLWHGLPVFAMSLGPSAGDNGEVVDLSALWAGPLCGRLLAERGMRVTKVESRTRPDGARRGSPAFFELLNGIKDHRTIDFTREAVTDAIRGAAVVIESSRPRALDQLGVERDATIWVSITGYGRASNRVAFGDDAAVAGGLVEHGDAVADPLAGITAAAAVVIARELSGRWLLDVSMAGVAAHVAGN